MHKEQDVTRKHWRRLNRLEKRIGDIALWIFIATAIYLPFHMLQQ